MAKKKKNNHSPKHKGINANSKKEIKFKTTVEIETSKKIVNQVIGQEHGVNVVKKAALQRRHVLLIGEPGTGKSMLGIAMAELLPKEKLVDILTFSNPNDENEPLVRTVPAGQGREIILKNRMQSAQSGKTQSIIIFILAILAMIAPWYILHKYDSEIMFAAFFLGGIGFLAAAVLFMNMGRRMMGGKTQVTPRLVVDNKDKKTAPFMDASGAHAGALLGDVLHDPFQSGGLGTPAHERVVAGMIHKAHNGVLFIDEIATLGINTQQELLTAIQEGKFAITGQSERSAGAMVRTEPVPCHFVMIAAGNMDTVEHMHPALRSRIRGYGYEIYMKDTMPDTPKNRNMIYQFIAQEVRKDTKIPHFTYLAAQRIIEIARKRANRKGHLTLRLRELGGIVRAAGDLAFERQLEHATVKEVEDALEYAKSLENQMVDQTLEREKDYEIIHTKGTVIGRVNGLAVAGDAGVVLPIEAAVTPGGKELKIIATGGLKDIAKESVLNVSAVIKKYFGEELKDKYDIYVQFLQQHNIDGDSASIAMATIIISSITKVPIKQSYAMTGSLSVSGDVLAVGGVTYKVEAAIKAGLTHVFIPHSNMGDIVIKKEMLKKIKVIPVKHITQVWEKVFEWKGHAKVKKRLLSSL